MRTYVYTIHTQPRRFSDDKIIAHWRVLVHKELSLRNTCAYMHVYKYMDVGTYNGPPYFIRTRIYNLYINSEACAG